MEADITSSPPAAVESALLSPSALFPADSVAADSPVAAVLEAPAASVVGGMLGRTTPAGGAVPSGGDHAW